MKPTIQWVLILLFILRSTVSGQPTPLHFKSLSINEGLSQGYVSAICQDKLGFLWFTTGDGLDKYDGYHFSVFHHDPDDSTTIADDDLTFVFEDAKERLWIGTRNNGLDYFDRRHNRFYHFRHSDAQSILSNSIEFLTEDSTGALWINTPQGIDRLQFLPKKKNDSSGTTAFPAEYDLVFTHLNQDSAFMAKMGGHDSRVSVFTDSRGHTFLSCIGHIFEANFSAGNRLDFTERYQKQATYVDFIPQLMEDPKSYSLFLNCEEIIRFPGYDFNLPHTVLDSNTHLLGSPSTIDRSQMIWVKEGNHLRRINIPTGEKEDYIPADSAQLAALGEMTCLFTDRQGTLWIGTGGYGILKYDPEIERFHHILPNTKQYQILETSKNELMTTQFEKIYIEKNHHVTFRNDESVAFLRTLFLHDNIIFFSKDSSGNVWIPRRDTIYFYNLRTNEKKIFKLSFVSGVGQIYPLYADKHSKLWFGLGENLVGFEPGPEAIIRVPYPIGLNNYNYDFLQTIYEDGEKLWLGSVGGIFEYNVATNTVERALFFNPDDSTSLSNNFVYCFCTDMKEPQRYLWVGTKGGGLNRLDKVTGKFTRYNTGNGLPNNVIYGILPGDDGNLWLSTNKGLCAFNPQTKVVRNFDVDDGLQSNEFNRYAYCKTSDGLLVFGGMNGLNYFDPAEIKPIEPPLVTFTDFLLFNKPVKLNGPESPLKININYEDAISLNYDQNVITLEFAALDFRRSGNIVYRHKMEGFDKDWIYSGVNHDATYTNLDPGHYHFAVQAAFEDGSWGNDEKTIAVTIRTPWFQAWWFYLLVAIATLAVLYGLYRFRLFQLKRLEKLRNRIARDLHDEVGSSISTIAIYSKIMQEQMHSVDFDNAPLVNKINDFAGEIMESMNDIIWNINTLNDSFERIISRMREHAVQLLEAKGYAVVFTIDEMLYRMKLNMELRRDFYLIYKESLNNIAKYASGANVWITLRLENNGIVLIIKDDGKGFDAGQAGSGGNGLNNIRHRAKSLKGSATIDSVPGEGTQIQLRFPIAS
jgi:ligand-binding sensor domain-containing protein